MKKRDFFAIFAIEVFCILVLLVAKPNTFLFTFDTSFLVKYLNSQDIPYEPKMKRVFLSDDQIYISSGYFYAIGAEPTKYDFQHPPLIKYLYGYSSLLFGNPYLVQVSFGVLLAAMVYFFVRRLGLGQMYGLLAASLMIIDPVFIEVSSKGLLDLGQSFFALLYVYYSLYNRKSYVLRGFVLGLCAASKFWAPALFITVVIAVYHTYKKELDMKGFVKHLFVAFFVFSCTYFDSFLHRSMMFNLVLFQLKTLKYWFHHSVSSIPFAYLFLFLTGYFRTWWKPIEMIRAETWTVLYPIGLTAQIMYILKAIKKKTIDDKLVVTALPILYLLYLGIQAPYSRYFIFFLPYFYISVVYIAHDITRRVWSRKDVK